MNVVIMQHFTMNPPPETPTNAQIEQTAHVPTDPRHRLATDPATGRVYDLRARQLAEGLPAELRPAMEALAAVRLAGRLMHLNMERWADRFGLSEGRLQVLFRLLKAADNRLAMNQLAFECSVSPRNITGLIDQLEKAGLAERRPDPNDRRSIQAVLTPEGKTLMSSLWQDTMAHQAPLAGQFTEQELTTLRDLCLRLAQHMERAAEEDSKR